MNIVNRIRGKIQKNKIIINKSNIIGIDNNKIFIFIIN